ncbi:MAG: DUF2017 domain-containing protein [Nocardioidaceae bacterium]|nr:DUF2017 domain-containing protein [Nocardioidaceae bacterium]NUS51151.1 DUF2017 domain-containing protein [Nocardioidaceae bacterium]
MHEGFQRRRHGGAVATFSGFEADLLRSLASQLVELLRNEVAAPSAGDDPLEELLDFTGPTTEPEDPVLARLFPTAYPHDEEAAGEFRRFTEGTLRDQKAQGAVAVIETLEEAGLPEQLEKDGLVVDVELDHEGAMLWMKSFTDIRLALGTRLGVEQDDEEYWMALSQEDPRAHVYDIYQWVGFLQETLVDAVAQSR